jgi:hypothetical protein
MLALAAVWPVGNTLLFADTADFYMAPNGDDNAVGDISHPFKTPQKLLAMLQPGQLGYARGGTYTLAVMPASGDAYALNNKSGTARTKLNEKHQPIRHKV